MGCPKFSVKRSGIKLDFNERPDTSSLKLTGCYRKRHMTDQIDVYGICLTTDMDNLCHMNNSRYLRECDFGRVKFILVTQLWKSLRKCGGTIINAGNNIRYRKSIELFDIYKIRTKIIYWDEKAFYIEQHFVRVRDGFICAVNIVKMAVTGTTPHEVVKDAMRGNSPQPSLQPDLKKLIESWQLSSENLRKNS